MEEIKPNLPVMFKNKIQLWYVLLQKDSYKIK